MDHIMTLEAVARILTYVLLILAAVAAIGRNLELATFLLVAFLVNREIG